MKKIMMLAASLMVVNMALAKGFELQRNMVNLGVLGLKSKTEALVTCYNRSPEPVVIKNVAVECNCTKVKWDRAPLMPGDSTTLRITYSADNVGQFYKTIRIVTTGAPEPVKLVIRGEVR